MKNFIQIILDKLKYLCDIYENYIWKKGNGYLDVIMGDNSIYFYLYDQDRNIDSFIISFNDKETKLFHYICVRLMISSYGKLKAYKEGNIIYNKGYRNYIKIVVLDNELLDYMNTILKIQENSNIDEEMEIVKRLYKKIPKKIYPYSFIDEVDDRINISKKILSR